MIMYTINISIAAPYFVTFSDHNYCLLNVDSVKDSVKKRDNVLFVPMVKSILQKRCHILSGLVELPVSVDAVLSAMQFSF